MKIALFGISQIKPGRHNLKDPRLDQVDQFVEADKKTPAQVELTGEDALLDADSILATGESKMDLILKDLEFIETRLGRDPEPSEKQVLEKLKNWLESEKLMVDAGLTSDEVRAIAAHHFFTNKPVTIASPEQLQEPDSLLLRTFAEAGYICFLTVGGKENRAWPIRKGLTALEAAGSIHTDLQKGFIRAEIIGFMDLVTAGGETQAKRAGKQRLETKTYVIEDYDVVNFRFSK
jgi:hypothetical protein